MKYCRTDMLDRLANFKLEKLMDTGDLKVFELKNGFESFLFTFFYRSEWRIVIQSSFFTEVVSSLKGYDFQWFFDHDDETYVLSKFLVPVVQTKKIEEYYRHRARDVMDQFNQERKDDLEPETCDNCSGEGRVEDHNGSEENCEDCGGNGTVCPPYDDILPVKFSTFGSNVATIRRLLVKELDADLDEEDTQAIAETRSSIFLHAADTARWTHSEEKVAHIEDLLFGSIPQSLRAFKDYQQPLAGWLIAGQMAFRREVKKMGLQIVRPAIEEAEKKEAPAAQGLLSTPYFKQLMPIHSTLSLLDKARLG